MKLTTWTYCKERLKTERHQETTKWGELARDPGLSFSISLVDQPSGVEEFTLVT